MKAKSYQNIPNIDAIVCFFKTNKRIGGFTLIQKDKVQMKVKEHEELLKH